MAQPPLRLAPARFAPRGYNPLNRRNRKMARSDASPADEHRRRTASSIACSVVTVSDTRTLADDRSGATIVELLGAAGHSVAARLIVPDEPADVAIVVGELAIRPDVAAVLVTGGTGPAPRDQTPDALRRLFTKELPGFGELFRSLSYQEIGAAAMLSRATAGLVNGTAVFLMPGSTAAVRLAMERLILPELAHLVVLAKGQA
jgi:molybdenum cofactor biosynthesis protein B